MEIFWEIIDDLFITLNPHYGFQQPKREIFLYRGDQAVCIANAGAINNYSNIFVKCIYPDCDGKCDVHPFCAPHACMTLRVRIGDESPYGIEGLYATGDPGEIVFRKGDYIAPYTGICMSKAENDTLYSKSKEFSPYTVMFDDMMVDSMLAMSYGAKANTHNVYLSINADIVYDNRHPYLVATKPILANTEILTLYVPYNSNGKLAFRKKVDNLLNNVYKFEYKDGSKLPDIRSFFSNKSL